MCPVSRQKEMSNERHFMNVLVAMMPSLAVTEGLMRRNAASAKPPRARVSQNRLPDFGAALCPPWLHHLAATGRALQ